MTLRPSHHLHVWPWMRRFGQRFVLKDWLAITLWIHVIAWRQLDEAELAHELVHVVQWRHHGAMFPIRYLRASRAAAGIGGDRYRDNTFEAEARAAEAAVRERLLRSLGPG